jgi:NADH-quinone oxidoreductase subunit C
MSETQNSINNREAILAVIGSAVISTEIHLDQLTVLVSGDNLVEVANNLKNNSETKFEQLLDVTAIDWAEAKDGNERFQVIYFLYSLTHNHRIRIKVNVSEDDCTSPSLTSVWESANWYEREAYDMYGIKFSSHPDMRRFYMPEDFADPDSGEQLYPLRKDFPLGGIPDSLPLPSYPEKFGDPT